MTDHKFTDDEIIKALECCSGIARCAECPYAEIEDCAKRNTIDAKDLINSQKAEIERLNGIVAEKSKNITYAAKELIRLDRERSEVIKEFANNVVQELWKLNWHYGQLPCSEEDKTIQRAIKECIAVVERNTKVMTEGNHESQNT